jgi:hypothetical protein
MMNWEGSVLRYTQHSLGGTEKRHTKLQLKGPPGLGTSRTQSSSPIYSNATFGALSVTNRFQKELDVRVSIGFS